MNTATTSRRRVVRLLNVRTGIKAGIVACSPPNEDGLCCRVIDAGPNTATNPNG